MYRGHHGRVGAIVMHGDFIHSTLEHPMLQASVVHQRWAVFLKLSIWDSPLLGCMKRNSKTAMQWSFPPRGLSKSNVNTGCIFACSCPLVPIALLSWSLTNEHVISNPGMMWEPAFIRSLLVPRCHLEATSLTTPAS
eukprot:2882782-Amphidinium_carterae.1